MSLYNKLRPQTFDEMFGQTAVINILKHKLEQKCMPSVVLLVGDTGVGKTTMARITARELGCTPSGIIEINTGHVRGIDSVRDIDEAMQYRSLGGKAKAWILDECVQLPSLTQKAFLKVLEEVPPDTYFFLCTTDIDGLLPTFKGRCFTLALSPLTKSDLHDLLEWALEKEKATIPEKVADAIVTNSGGSGRRCINLLELALSCKPEEALLLIGKGEEAELAASEFLARLLFKKAAWSEIKKAIEAANPKEHEGLRRRILAYANVLLLSGTNQAQAYTIIRAFRYEWKDCGEAGLTAACYEVLKGIA